MRKKPVAEKPERICGQAQTLSELEEFNATISNHLDSVVRKIGNDLDQEITSKFLIPKFTVRGEHNVWHVYRNDERLEPPFRNEQRAKIERIYHERSHAIRNERK
jgi:hypothetical protein